MKTVKIDGLYEAAYRAHSGTSFSPERRASDCVLSCEAELNADLASIPEGERERYAEGYKKRLFAWLSAKAQCISSMITGPANFPVRRAERANLTEHNRLTEFHEWRDKALAAIARRVEDAKPEDQKVAERWMKLKRGLESSLGTIVAIDRGEAPYSRPLFVSSVAGTIKTLAKNGEVDLVSRCLQLIRAWNEANPKPVISARHSIWSLEQTAEANREAAFDRSVAAPEEVVVRGVRVVSNSADDRLQLFFDGKPDPDVITSLKRSAFKWSPSRGCWQRQLTNNAVAAARAVLSLIPVENA